MTRRNSPTNIIIQGEPIEVSELVEKTIESMKQEIKRSSRTNLKKDTKN